MRNSIALAALGACILAPSADAAVTGVNIQPPTYDSQLHKVSLVINFGTTGYGYGLLWSHSGNVIEAQHTFDNGGKWTFVVSCTPDPSGALTEWGGQAILGSEQYQTINGPERWFACS